MNRRQMISDAIIDVKKVKAVNLAQKVVEKVLQNVRTNVSAGLKEHLQPILQEQCKILLNGLIDTVQGYAPKKGLPLLPPDCRMSSQSGDIVKFLIEQPPRLRTISVNPRVMQRELEMGGVEHSFRYRLSFPYTVFVIAMEMDSECRSEPSVYFGFRNEPIKSLDDTLGLPPLPNIENHHVCMGGDFFQILKKTGAKTDLEIVEQTLDIFWNSEWTDHYTWPYGMPPEVASLAMWEKLSTRDPSAILKIKWMGGFPVRDFICPSVFEHSEIFTKMQMVMRQVSDTIIKESLNYMENHSVKDMNYEQDAVVATFATTLRELVSEITQKIFDGCEQLIRSQKAKR